MTTAKEILILHADEIIEALALLPRAEEHVLYVRGKNEDTETYLARVRAIESVVTLCKARV